MVIITEFVPRSTSLPLVSIPTALRPDKVKCTHILCLQPDVQMFTVQFEREDGVTKADLLTRDEAVAIDATGETANRGVYKLIVELAKSVSKVFESGFGGVQVEPTIVTTDGWHKTEVFKEYGGFNRFREGYEAHGISLGPVSIVSKGSVSDEPTDNLADRQREALTLTVSHGYYESP